MPEDFREQIDELATGQESPKRINEEDVPDPEEERSLREQARNQMPPPPETSTRVEITQARKPLTTEDSNSQTLNHEKHPSQETTPSELEEEPSTEQDLDQRLATLHLRLQIAKQEAKAAKYRIKVAKHERSVSDVISEIHEPKRRRVVKRPTKEEIYFNIDYPNFRRFCH